MSCLRPFGLKCIAVILATQLYAVPAIAESVSSGGFIVIGSKQLSLHLRSKHHVHRYYGAPKAYYPKAKVSSSKAKTQGLLSKEQAQGVLRETEKTAPPVIRERFLQ